MFDIITGFIYIRLIGISIIPLHPHFLIPSLIIQKMIFPFFLIISDFHASVHSLRRLMNLTSARVRHLMDVAGLSLTFRLINQI